jgi:hypothetical protein
MTGTILTSSHVNSVTIASSIALRLRHVADHIHSLGPGPLFQMLCEFGDQPTALTRFECYARLDSDFIRANGGDVLPPILKLVK